MKKLNKIFIALSVIGLFTIAGCNENVNPTEDTPEGGAILTTAKSNGKALGLPEAGVPMEDASVTFLDVAVNFDVRVHKGGFTVSKYEVVKSINGGAEVSVVEGAALPLQVNNSTIDEIVAGTGVAVGDLRIGDLISYQTKITTGDGRVIYAGPNQGSFNMTVQCVSDMAGEYTVLGTDSNGNVIGPFDYTVTETAPGEYQGSRSGPWGPNSGFTSPTGESRIVFTDVCGNLFVPEQFLNLGEYSNGVYGADVGEGVAGNFNATTGVISLEYTIEFGSGNRIYTETITPK